MNTNEKVLFNSHLSLTGYDKAKSLTIVSGDKTQLDFTLKDKNAEPIKLTETTGQAQIVDSNRNVLVAVFNVEVSESQASLIIDKALPADEYELYLKIGEFYFPSREDSFMLRVIEAYDVVETIDTENVQTIDIVVDALAEKITPLLSEQAETIFRAIVTESPELYKGDKGDAFTVNDFTEEEWLSLQGENALPLAPSQMSPEDVELVRGHKGDTGDSAYDEALNNGFVGTKVEWLASLKGETGDSAYIEAFNSGFAGTKDEWLESLNGLDGTVAYSDLDETQKADLRVPPMIYTRDEYNLLEVKDANTLYFIEEA